MYLPQIYEKFSQEFPDVTEKYKQLGVACRSAGSLDEKTRSARMHDPPLMPQGECVSN